MTTALKLKKTFIAVMAGAALAAMPGLALATPPVDCEAPAAYTLPEDCYPNGSADLPPQGETETLDGDATSYLAPEETKLEGPLALALLGGTAGVFLITRKLAGRLVSGRSDV